MSNKKPQKMTIDEKIQVYNEEHKKLLDKLDLKPQHVIHFPRHEKVPFLSRMCLKTIQRQGGEIATQLYDVSKK